MRLLSLLKLMEFTGKADLVYTAVTEFVIAEIVETAEFAKFAFFLSLLQVLGSKQIVVVVVYKSLFLFFFGEVTELVS